jgi:hypothetical protein
MEIETTEKDSNNEKIIGLYNISLTVLDGVRFGFGFGVGMFIWVTLSIIAAIFLLGTMTSVFVNI